MASGQFFQSLLAGGSLPALGFARRGQIQGLEEHIAHLLGRTDVEGRSRRRVDLGGEAVQLVLYVGEKGLERGGVDSHAAPFHFGQHRGKRQFQRIVKLAQPVADQTILQGFGHSQSQPGRTPALGFQSRPPARGQAGPAVIAFLGIEQIGGQAQVETARRRFAQRQIAPTGRGGQQGLEIGHHQPPGRLQPGAEHVHAPGPAVFRSLRRLGQRIAHGQMRRLLGTLRPDQGHMVARAVRQGGDIRKFRGQRFFNGIQQAHLRARAGLGPRDAAG